MGVQAIERLTPRDNLSQDIKEWPPEGDQVATLEAVKILQSPLEQAPGQNYIPVPHTGLGTLEDR